jgi:CheY-like chemotaxis protein
MTPVAIKSPILVVEDSDEDFDTLLQMLSKSGISSKVYRALNGDDCLAQLRGDGGSIGVHPAFILMDLNCPGTDG